MGSSATPSRGAGSPPRDGLALLGPLLTERAFARRAGLSPSSVRAHRCIPRIDSPVGLGAAYPAFMLGDDGLRLDLAFVTLLVRRRVNDREACDWLVRPNPTLGGQTPLGWIADGLPLERAIDALPAAPPEPDHRPSEASAIREEWLRFKGDEETPGWTIAWDRISRRAPATPHGV